MFNRATWSRLLNDRQTTYGPFQGLRCHLRMKPKPDDVSVAQVPKRGGVHHTQRGHPEPPEPVWISRAVCQGWPAGGRQCLPLWKVWQKGGREDKGLLERGRGRWLWQNMRRGKRFGEMCFWTHCLELTTTIPQKNIVFYNFKNQT